MDKIHYVLIFSIVALICFLLYLSPDIPILDPLNQEIKANKNESREVLTPKSVSMSKAEIFEGSKVEQNEAIKNKKNMQYDESIAARILIQELLANDYSKAGAFEWPKLEWTDIPYLLQWASNEQILTKFPRSGLSSQYQPECRLGVVVLWFIESIRSTQGNPYPSLNPILSTKKNPYSTSQEAHKKAAEAYKKWWDQVKEMPKDEAKKINPLDGLIIFWY